MEIKKVLVRMSVSDLIPYEKNPRKIPDEAISDVCESYRQCGVIDPIEIDEENVILSGHTRRLAALKMGINEVDCLRVEGLTSEQKRKYRILANKTGEKSMWDFDLLEWELEDLDFEGYDFGFEIEDAENWFNREDRNNTAKQEGNEEYNEFLDKFEVKKTTDDCYTPDEIYEAVKNWAVQEYGITESQIVRPFYPNGDYQKEKYAPDSVVLDNPPFSIISEIVRWYCENGVKFFLFAPALTLFTAHEQKVTYVGVGVSVTYENGADVNTSFITNLDNCRARTAPALYNALFEANKVMLRKLHQDLPKYAYPPEVLTSTMLNKWCKAGVEVEFDFDECVRISELDAQKAENKAIFGGGFLLSTNAGKKTKQAERGYEESLQRRKVEDKPTYWELSEREKKISRELNKETGRQDG